MLILKVLYNGDPSAADTSIEYQNYNAGVKWGCWCLFAEAISSAIYAFVLENYLLAKFSTKLLFFAAFLVYGTCITCFFFTENIYLIMFLFLSDGVLATTLCTLPYQMLSEFHEDKNYRKKSKACGNRGFGIDCALISSCFFLAQTLVASYTSPLVGVFGEYTVVVTSASFAFLGCIWISLVMKFPVVSENG
jgi:solute carrier family 45 protein 1/2/4